MEGGGGGGGDLERANSDPLCAQLHRRGQVSEFFAHPRFVMTRDLHSLVINCPHQSKWKKSVFQVYTLSQFTVGVASPS